MERHASLNTTQQSCTLVAAEIDPHLFSERRKDAPENVRFGMSFLRGFHGVAVGHEPPDVGMIGDVPDLLCDLTRWKVRIDKAGANGAARHRVKFRARFTLREGQPASRFDRAQTRRAIGATSRQDYAYSTRTALLG